MKQGKLNKLSSESKEKGGDRWIAGHPCLGEYKFIIELYIIETTNIYSIYVVSLPKLVSDIVSSKLCCVDVVLL